MELLREERGAVIVIAALLLSVSLLLLAMVVDLGTVWLVKARLQTALDAATLAAASEAQVQVHKSFVPNHKTEFFSLGSQLPELEVKREERWDWEIVGYEITYETPEGKIEKAIFRRVSDCPYPRIGTPVPIQEEVFLGWDITYVESYSEQVESVALWLDDWEASSSAFEVMDINSQTERQSGVRISPVIAEKTPSTGDSVAYYMEVQVEVPSQLLAPLMRLFSGPTEPRFFRFRVRSESKAFLHIGGD
jgi:hypothetical protein